MFLLMLRCGLRIAETAHLLLSDLYLDEPHPRLVARGKGSRERSVYLSRQAERELRIYLYRNQPVSKDLVRGRLKAAGDAVEVKVYPHRLRHTAATQLLNAGCRIMSIQKFLGHNELSTTTVYARVHDETVEDDYYRAMSIVEKRLDLLGVPEEKPGNLSEDEREQVLAISTRLAEPELSVETRLALVSQIHLVLLGEPVTLNTPLFSERRRQDHPSPSLNVLGQP